ncbi:MAG: restriction endonuclease subunit S [Nitrospira sp.]|nr:restriction endonuclease subunit S [Nitrospira sp.]
MNGVARVPPEFDGATASTGFCVLRPKADRLDSQYLYQWVKSPLFVSDMVRKATGASYPAVSDRIVCESKLPLPPLPEQRRIAVILDKADELRAKRRTALTKLDRLTQSIFLDMFGDPVTNPKGWPICTIGDVVDIIVPTRDKPKSFTGDIPWVTLPDLTRLFVTGAKNLLSEREAAQVGNRLIPCGSVLLSCAATVGRVAIVRRSVYANQQFYGLVPRKDLVVPEYIALCLEAMGDLYFKQLGGSFTISFFSRDKTLSIPLPLPPLERQLQLTGLIDAVETLRARQEESLEKFDAAFESLRHRAFRGEL